MGILISQEEFDKKKSKELVPFECLKCHIIKQREKERIKRAIKVGLRIVKNRY